MSVEVHTVARDDAAASEVDYDVIVVGGGFAGATAARELTRAGKSVLLVEARDRLGGRTWFRDSPEFGRELEMGGTYVTWYQPYVWAEITRYGIELITSPGAIGSETFSFRLSGKQKVFTAAEADALMEEVLEAFFDGDSPRELMPRPFDPLFRVDELKKLDHLSIEDRIGQLDFDEERKELLRTTMGIYSGNLCTLGGYLDMMRFWSLAGYSTEGLWGSWGSFKMKTGTKSLIEAIAADSTAEFRFSSPVASVVQNDKSATVRLRSGEQFTCSQVVVAVALNVLDTIEFSPPLSEGKQAFAAEKQVCLGIKLWVRIRGNFPEPITAMAPDYEALTFAQTEEFYDDGQLLVIFGSVGMDDVDVNDTVAVSPHVNKLLGQDVEIVAVTGKKWVDDEFAKGGWSVYRPNQLTKYMQEAQRPEGRVFFAGSDIADGWNGDMDGAIESGLTTARAIINATGQSAPPRAVSASHSSR